ncbi:Rpn family recombination-promoting nuclease/putative transposase [Pendulispora albinea]|uniref:Rpn family recombination-promoting nuclease/putative transposase n=2 Tax=Pendulispora albinea TaxID=2741071 RepID=A0ABZ2M2Z8_9BACT
MLRSVVPREVADQIQWESLERVSVAFIDEEFSKLYADLLFAAKLRGHEAFLWLLFEHQSSSDPWMAFRVLEYAVRVWKDWLRAHEKATRLPAIVPVVLHHSERGWTASTSFSELLDLDEGTKKALGPYLIDFRFLLDDLTRHTDDEIQARALTELAEMVALAFKHLPYDEEPVRTLEKVAPLMVRLMNEHDGLAALSAFFRYTMQVSDVESGTLRTFVATNVGKKAEEIVMSTAEKLIQQGQREGRVALLRKLFIARFGAFPAEVAERARHVSPEELDHWAERLLMAQSIDEVFDGSASHRPL